MPALLHTHSRNFFLTDCELLAKSMENLLRVDGAPKREKETTTIAAFP
ncbi:MAG TPA: hypothetical protein VEF36_02820 [Roseiarcus sp.]|nr:hypothetical protein [Roseiarcus sp.]